MFYQTHNTVHGSANFGPGFAQLYLNIVSMRDGVIHDQTEDQCRNQRKYYLN
jgi:hypothetical protein